MTLLGARGSCVGWGDLPSTLRSVAAHHRGEKVAFQDLAIHEGADVACNVRLEHSGQGVTIRATQVFRREERRRRIVLRNGDIVSPA